MAKVLAASLMFLAGCAHAQTVPPVVMMTEVFACGKYRGAFLVTADGHWIYENQYSLSKKDADKAIANLPKYAQAYLDPFDPAQGDCPPKVAIHLEEP